MNRLSTQNLRADFRPEIRHGFGGALSLLVLLAFLVRSLIPLGFMPGQAGKGLLPLVICAGSGAQTIYLPADKIPANKISGAPAQDHHAPPPSHAGFCLFSVGALFHGAAPAAVLPMAPLASAAFSAFSRLEAPFRATVAAYDPQGPPVSPLHD